MKHATFRTKAHEPKLVRTMYELTHRLHTTVWFFKGCVGITRIYAQTPAKDGSDRLRPPSHAQLFVPRAPEVKPVVLIVFCFQDQWLSWQYSLFRSPSLSKYCIYPIVKIYLLKYALETLPMQNHAESILPKIISFREYCTNTTWLPHSQQYVLTTQL